MKTRISLRNIIAGAILLAGGACTSIPAEKQNLVNFGYNAIENAAASSKNTRTRLLNNASISAGVIEAGYHGLNEVDNLDETTYFGRHSLEVGLKSFPIRPNAVLKTDNTGLFNTKFGLRDTSLIGVLGGYGFVEVGANHDAANFTTFYGRNLGTGWSASAVLSADGNFNDKPKWYAELQLNKEIWPHVSAFGRVEIEFNRAAGTEDTTGLIGVTISK